MCSSRSSSAPPAATRWSTAARRTGCCSAAASSHCLRSRSSLGARCAKPSSFKWGQTLFFSFALSSQMRKMGSVPIYYSFLLRFFWRGIKQHFRCGARGARDLRILAHQRRGERALHQDLELQGDAGGILHAHALEQRAVPGEALLLELHRDAGRGVLAVAELGDRVDVGTAAEAAFGEQALEAVEVGEDLLARRRVRKRNVPAERREIRRDQLVLGRVIVVERPLADAGLGGDGVDADRADALLVEQLVGGGEDACRVRRGLMHRSVYFTLDSIVRAAGS